MSRYRSIGLVALLSCVAPAACEDPPARVRLAFGSCAFEDEGTAGTWRRIGEARPDAVVLLGDTPYIDTTDLETQRRRYREFAAVEAMRDTLRETPLYATWDDHDFGRNDTDGRLEGKENSRRVFIEFHDNPSYGEDDQGIYTSFREGPVEVFLLDTRWFAATEVSWADPEKPTLLGARQWEWLQRGLLESTAPVKVLACGMIWNEATRPGKPDHWGTYAHERDAVFAFIRENEIAGVILVGGDVHRSRVVRHGDDLVELITSPMHGSIIEAANAPHPGLVWDAGEPFSFLLLEVDATGEALTTTARFIGAGGVVFECDPLGRSER